MRHSFTRDEGGQAFVEAAIFLPLLVLALTAIIFFARLGVLAERAETAVRYGDLISFRGGQAYTTAAVGYLLNQAVFHNTSTQLADLCLASPPVAATSGPTAAPTGINADIAAALTQTQVVDPSASAAPSPQRFFRADNVLQPACGPGTVNLSGHGASSYPSDTYPVGDLPVNVDSFSITAVVGMNNFLAPSINNANCSLMSGSACSTTTANMAFINLAAPTQLITCVPGLSIVLTVMNPLAAGNTPTCH